jgi:hypothetical protein
MKMSKNPSSQSLGSFKKERRIGDKSVAIVCVVYWETWMILEDSIATCPFRPPRNVGGAYWSSFQYCVLVRPANHGHDLFAGMILHMLTRSIL